MLTSPANKESTSIQKLTEEHNFPVLSLEDGSFGKTVFLKPEFVLEKWDMVTLIKWSFFIFTFKIQNLTYLQFNLDI